MSNSDTAWLLKTLDDSAAQLAVSKSTLRRIIKAGTLSTVRVGGRRLVDSRDLDAFVASAKQGGGAR
jgi:excisionase family DNA binding protein